MQKVYERTNFENYPSTDTPLNETNMNKIDYAVDTIDDRVIVLDTTKTNQSDFLQSVHSVTFNNATGVLTVTYENGTVYTVDTKIEKIAINFEYDDDPTSPHYQQLVITLDDGTKQYVDMSALITQYEFDNSTDIAFTVTNGRVSANIIDGSVTREKISPDYLAQIDAQVNTATLMASTSTTQALKSEGFAVGEQNGTVVASDSPYYQNNAKYYKEHAYTSATNASISESHASTSENNALSYKNSASTSATNAHTSEVNAHTSEVNALASENNASTSETNAHTSEVNALASEVASAQSESNAEAWAIGQRDGVDVPSTDPTYENNSKYYSQQAYGYKTDAESAKTDAESAVTQIQTMVGQTTFTVDMTTGELNYTNDSTYNFNINTTTGNLEWEVVA